MMVKAYPRTLGLALGPIPIAFSPLATFYSATALLGAPAEVYTYGIQVFVIMLGMTVTPIIGALYTGPLFARLKLLSVFEYLRIQFNSNSVRLVGMGCYLLRAWVSTAIFVYGSSTSLSFFTDLTENIAIAIFGIIATFDTTIGIIAVI